jgi:hypothetical protein
LIAEPSWRKLQPLSYEGQDRKCIVNGAPSGTATATSLILAKIDLRAGRCLCRADMTVIVRAFQALRSKHLSKKMM